MRQLVYPWVTGWLATAALGVAVGAVLCKRKRFPAFIQAHRWGASLAFVLVAIHGAMQVGTKGCTARASFE